MTYSKTAVSIVNEKALIFPCWKYFPTSSANGRIISTDYVEVTNISYKTNSVFVIDLNDDFILFGKIVNIFVKEKDVYFLLKPLINMYFDEHISAFKVEENGNFILKNINNLPSIHECNFIKKEPLEIPKYIL